MSGYNRGMVRMMAKIRNMCAPQGNTQSKREADMENSSVNSKMLVFAGIVIAVGSGMSSSVLFVQPPIPLGIDCQERTTDAPEDLFASRKLGEAAQIR